MDCIFNIAWVFVLMVRLNKIMKIFLQSIGIGIVSLGLCFLVFVIANNVGMQGPVILIAGFMFGFFLFKYFRKGRFVYLYLIWRNMVALYGIVILFMFVGYGAGNYGEGAGHSTYLDIFWPAFWYGILPLLSILLPYLALKRSSK